jgi:hypothetical protein
MLRQQRSHSPPPQLHEVPVRYDTVLAICGLGDRTVPWSNLLATIANNLDHPIHGADL